MKTVLHNLALNLAIILTLSSCDGIRSAEYALKLDQEHTKNNIKSSEFQTLFDLLGDLATRHGLNYNPNDEREDYFRWGELHLSLAGKIQKETHVITIEVGEFGPWSATEEYEALKAELAEMLKRNFPSQNVQK